MSRRPIPNDLPILPHPAEDLSADDDLLSWILVDQLGAMPNTKLGVHPQQVKFVGPVFKTEEVLKIVQEVCEPFEFWYCYADFWVRPLYRERYRRQCISYRSMSELGTGEMLLIEVDST